MTCVELETVLRASGVTCVEALRHDGTWEVTATYQDGTTETLCGDTLAHVLDSLARLGRDDN